MFKKIIIWLLCITLAIPGVGSILYFTVPKVKDYVNEKILKVEQISNENSEDETDTENAELVASLQEEIASNKQVITNLNSELEKQRVEVTKLQNEAKTSEELINTLQTSINSKQAELDTIIVEKQALEQQKAEIQEEVNAKATEIETLQTSITEKEQTISGLQSDIETKQAELETLKSEANADAETIANLESDIQAKQSELATLQAEAEEDAQTIATLEAGIEAKQTELEQLRNEADADAETIAQLESSIEEKQNLVNELQTIKENNETTIANLEADVTAKQNTITELQTKANEDATTIESLQADVTAKQNTITELEAQAEEDTKTIEEINSQIAQKQELLYDAYDEINRLDAQILELDTDINALEEERDALLVTISEKNTEIETLQGNITTLEDEVSAKEVEIASLNEQIAVLEETLNKTEGKVYISEIFETAEALDIALLTRRVSTYEYLIVSGTNDSSFQGIYLYNSVDSSVEKLHDNGYALNQFFEYPGVGMVLTSGYVQSKGAYFYDYSTKKVTKFVSVGNSYAKHLILSSGDMILGGSNSGYVLYFDVETKEFSVIYDVAGTWMGSGAVAELANGNVLFSSGTSNKSLGLYLLNVETKEVTIVEDATVYYNIKVLSSGLCVLRSDDKTYFFNSSDNSISPVSDSLYFTYYDEINENGDIMFSGKSSSVGTYIYRYLDKSLTYISADVNLKNYYIMKNKDVLITCIYQKDAYLFKSETEELINLGYVHDTDCSIFEDCGNYVRVLSEEGRISGCTYYILGSTELTTTEPIMINFNTITLDDMDNILAEGTGGSVAITPSALKVGGSVTVSSGANDGYYLHGIYADEELTTLVLDWLSGETALNYSDISQYIDSETNTITLYAVFLESDENSSTGQEGTGELEGPPEEGEM